MRTSSEKLFKFRQHTCVPTTCSKQLWLALLAPCAKHFAHTTGTKSLVVRAARSTCKCLHLMWSRLTPAKRQWLFAKAYHSGMWESAYSSETSMALCQSTCNQACGSRLTPAKRQWLFAKAHAVKHVGVGLLQRSSMLEKTPGRNESDATVQRIQCLQPMLTLLTSTDGSCEINDIRQHGNMLHQCQEDTRPAVIANHSHKH